MIAAALRCRAGGGAPQSRPPKERTDHLKSRILTATVAAAVCITCVVGLSACGSAHEIIASGEACASCHDEKTTYEVASPANAVACGTQLTVQTKESAVVVCKPIFISEDGSSYVPQRASQVNVKDGSAALTLEEGTWVICTADGDKVKAQKLITVSAANSGSTTVEL